jgi:hypothetical protein
MEYETLPPQTPRDLNIPVESAEQSEVLEKDPDDALPSYLQSGVLLPSDEVIQEVGTPPAAKAGPSGPNIHFLQKNEDMEIFLNGVTTDFIVKTCLLNLNISMDSPHEKADSNAYRARFRLLDASDFQKSTAKAPRGCNEYEAWVRDHLGRGFNSFHS